MSRHDKICPNTLELPHDKTNQMTCMPSKVSYQHRLWWADIPFCWFCQAAPHFRRDISVPHPQYFLHMINFVKRNTQNSLHAGVVSFQDPVSKHVRVVAPDSENPMSQENKVVVVTPSVVSEMFPLEGAVRVGQETEKYHTDSKDLKYLDRQVWANSVLR